jgi:hypothetical protein
MYSLFKSNNNIPKQQNKMCPFVLAKQAFNYGSKFLWLFWDNLCQPKNKVLTKLNESFGLKNREEKKTISIGTNEYRLIFCGMNCIFNSTFVFE